MIQFVPANRSKFYFPDYRYITNLMLQALILQETRKHISNLESHLREILEQKGQESCRGL